MVAAVGHVDLTAGRIAKDIKIVVNQLELVQGLIQLHGRHLKVFATDAPAGQRGLFASGEGCVDRLLVDHRFSGWSQGGSVPWAVVVVLNPVVVALQLTAEFAGGQINAGVKIVAVFLGADHGSIGKDRHLHGLLGNPGVAGDRKVHIGFLDQALEMVNGAAQFGFGVLADGFGDVKIAAMDQQFHGIAVDSSAQAEPR